MRDEGTETGPGADVSPVVDPAPDGKASSDRPDQGTVSPGAPTVLVIGATGRAGGYVLQALRERARLGVRAMTRTPGGPAARALAAAGTEVVGGDIDDLDSMRNAMAGCYAVAVCLDAGARDFDPWLQVRTLVDAAADSGIGHVAVALLNQPAIDAVPAAEEMRDGASAIMQQTPLAELQAYAHSIGVATSVVWSENDAAEVPARALAAVLEPHVGTALHWALDQPTQGQRAATSPSTTNS